MKCQILFSGENKKNITTLSSAELAKTGVTVSESLDTDECMDVQQRASLTLLHT